MKWLEIDRNGGIARLVMNRGKTHALDPELTGELRTSFDAILGDDSTNAVILTGAGDRFFCNGLDISVLLDLAREEMGRFFDGFIALYTTMYLFPKPLVAAINGHAMAGGLILALAADYRLMCDENRYVGLSEVKLGLPVPEGAVRMLSSLVGNREAQRLALYGDILLPEAAYRAGLVNEVTSFKHLEIVARTVAQDLAAMPGPAYATTKRYLRHQTASAMQSKAEESREEFLDCWYLPKSQTNLKNLAARKS